MEGPHSGGLFMLPLEQKGKTMYRIKIVAHDYFHLLTPDGIWIGPGTGGFRTIASAMDWLEYYLKRM